MTIPVARPGDEMPGGGRFVTAAIITGWQIDVNNAREVVFNASLDTDANGDGFPDTGLYVWSHGRLRLVARTGTEIPGVGMVAHLVMDVPTTTPPSGFFPTPERTTTTAGRWCSARRSPMGAACCSSPRRSKGQRTIAPSRVPGR